jgi:maltose alpha-D-glucosyltransferase / alpha-amylase
VLKIFRRIEPAINPEYEIGRFLTERGFARMPTLTGAIQYVRPGLETGTLGVVQTAVKHQGSGWDYTIDELRRFFERVAAREPGKARDEIGPFFEALAHYYLQSAETLGRRTAELHAALARGNHPAFAPEAVDNAAMRKLADTMIAHAEGMLHLLGAKAAALPEHSRDLGAAVLAARNAIVRPFEALRTIERGGQRIRVHGDYHLGQVLRTEEDFVILDFEGEPARPIAERRQKQSPLKDVAGMLRSFNYGAYVALFTWTVHTRDAAASSLESWADTWQRAVSDAFTRAYVAHVTAEPTASDLLPDGETRERMLRAFTLDKALYELGYELNHRPDWVRIPLIGILKLIG